MLLKDSGENGSVGSSTASIKLTGAEADDLARYLDVTRAEMLFARGIILVEGDAEKFLLPVFAETIGQPLDSLGITVCSVAGTNFQPYAKFLTALDIPFSIITDWDPRVGKTALGINRCLSLVETIENVRTGQIPKDLIGELKEIDNENEFATRCEAFGVFTNVHTLEVDLFNDGFTEEIIQTLREHRFGKERQGRIHTWEANPDKLDAGDYLAMIETIGKGRFAQRLASRIKGFEPPAYIRGAIEFVSSRV